MVVPAPGKSIIQCVLVEFVGYFISLLVFFSFFFFLLISFRTLVRARMSVGPPRLACQPWFMVRVHVQRPFSICSGPTLTRVWRLDVSSRWRRGPPRAPDDACVISIITSHDGTLPRQSDGHRSRTEVEYWWWWPLLVPRLKFNRCLSARTRILLLKIISFVWHAKTQNVSSAMLRCTMNGIFVNCSQFNSCPFWALEMSFLFYCITCSFCIPKRKISNDLFEKFKQY